MAVLNRRLLFTLAKRIVDHPHAETAFEMSYWRDGIDWMCLQCEAEGFVGRNELEEAALPASIYKDSV